jgi:hypothetical protein
MLRTLGLALVLLASCSALLADDLRTLDGKNLSGELTAITEAQLTFKTDDGSVQMPLSKVLAVDVRKARPIAPGTKFTLVQLLDDSLLHCQAVAFRGNEVELTLLSGTQLKLPVSALTWMLKDAENMALRTKFATILSQKSKRDRIVILRDGELNPLEGALGDVDAKGTSIPFRRDGAEQINALFDRLHGLIFFRTAVSSENPICKVHDLDGNTLIAVKMAYSPTDQLQIGTSFGTKITLKQETLAKFDFNIGKLTYLSDLEPVKVVERSGIGLVTHYRKDVNLDGEPILLDKQYAKGLSLHAHTELSYNLAGNYKEFKARLGADSRTGNESQALVTIYCDGEKRLAETVTVKNQKDIAFSVKDVSTLRIVVSSRNILDLHDHATLADARVSQ